MKKRLAYLGVIAVLTVMVTFSLIPRQTSAHGTEITYALTTAVEIDAAYDTGEPMANAQVTIYAPNDPARPWLKGQADESGHFVFTPDLSIAGRWDVTVRTAGHGDIIYIPIEEGAVTVVNNNSISPLQTILMSLAALWGFVGTSLYFSRRK